MDLLSFPFPPEIQGCVKNKDEKFHPSIHAMLEDL